MTTLHFQCDGPGCTEQLSFETGSFPREYRGGQPYTCTRCRHRGLYPHYCPDGQGTFSFEREHQGGRRVNCSCGRPFTIPVAGDAEVKARLERLGVRRLGRYQQGARIEALPEDTFESRTLKSEVSGGYCAGVVLDWIRRALLGPPTPPEAPRTTYKEPEVKPSARVDQRAARAYQEVERARIRTNLDRTTAVAHANLGNITEGARRDREHAAADAESDALYAEYSRRFDAYNARVREFNAQAIDRATLDQANALMEEALRAYRDFAPRRTQRREDAQRAYDQTTGALHARAAALNARTHLEHMWADFSSRMDALLAADRVARHKPAGPLARPFSDLTVARSTGKTTFNDGVRGLFAAVLDDDEFLPGRAASVGIDAQGGGSGHAVGFLKLPTGVFHMFDPNFGTFEAGRTALLEGLVYIFRVAYPNWPSARSSDNHPYEDTDGHASGHHTIFVGSQPAVPSVRERSLGATRATADAATTGTVTPVQRQAQVGTL